MCRAQIKTLPNLCWVGAGFLCHPIHVVLLQGRGQAALDRLNGAVYPAGTFGKEREEEGTAGQGRQSVLRLATLVDSRRKSEKDPVAQRRLHFSLMNLHNRNGAQG